MTRLLRILGGLVGSLLMIGPSLADSAIVLLSGFDQARIEAAYPADNDESLGELAKLLYRLGPIGSDALASRLDQKGPMQVGDAVRVEGELVQVRRRPIPESLVEFLEFTDLYFAEVVSSEGIPRRLVSASFPVDAQPGDRIVALGVAIELAESRDGQPGPWEVMATPRVQWTPKSSPKVGWRLLGSAGFDVALLSAVKQRSRQPLMAEDGDAFYSMLAAAAQLGRQTDTPPAANVQSVDLLRRPETLTGEWLQLPMESVQITRITVTEPRRREQLGQDHYFQIDAVVDLGNVIVKIERPDPASGPPAVFENRYPVSVVSAEIPEFLQDRIRIQEGGEAVVSQHRSLLAVDGFFYRLWSYQSEFMDQHGGGDQFGPLFVAARILDREPSSKDPAGVQIIGWLAAIAVIVGILFFWLWGRLVASRDREARRARQRHAADQVQLP
jgi:hypothetical protein